MFSIIFVLPVVIVCTLLTSFVAAAALNASNIVQRLSSSALGLSPGTKVFLRTDPGFANETARYTIHDPPTYIVAVRPALESDVQKIVQDLTGELNRAFC